ncbi:ectonucleotide pyrophosphatase/phosphodiesterase [Luteimonas sp. MC1825]|uniref:alkaline phosphatase family protein n=1 Tax=Luteimonas sp. MC1825 TaxID=2761107 RepID=UPI00161BB422|nr:ectonucleotide pyrophosphatase/phosphodiesterase [Luteimonas sp. MC1825]MBB6599821.1 alkaline phosphatase family protein [Luteimonas sp. MC1825]QOC87493.1 alkaline phosphatase family protein [Luteimonas sp. MC1825]
MHAATRTASLFAALAFALLASACSTPTALQPVVDAGGTAPATASDTLLLISIDGLHPDRINADDSPNLVRLAANGVQARWMTPSYPSLTFPNHYTIATGLRPDRHGIVHNSMHDAELGTFRLSDRDAVGTSGWWGGEPIWVGAENAGLRTATMFWPGSEAEVAGVRPTRWHVYDESASAAQRAATVAGWLLEPDATRPRLATLYFHDVDTAAHTYGPGSAEARAALVGVDAAFGSLLDALQREGRLEHTNIVLVSDHGMAEVPPGHQLSIDDLVTMEQARVVSIGQVLQVQPNAGHESEVATRLLGQHAHHECWRREDLPARWHYGTHPRVPAIVCQMDEGWDAVLPRIIEARAQGGMRGSHGYDPALPSMRAVFIASGPAFRRGAVIDAIDNVDVYPLLARLLGIAPADNDGDPEALLPALVPAVARP